MHPMVKLMIPNISVGSISYFITCILYFLSKIRVHPIFITCPTVVPYPCMKVISYCRAHIGWSITWGRTRGGRTSFTLILIFSSPERILLIKDGDET